MARGDYILCCKCGVKLIYDGDRSQREWLQERFGEESGIECPDCKSKREWQGLTDEEIALICGECAASAHKTDDISYARAIEAKLKEKNGI